MDDASNAGNSKALVVTSIAGSDNAVLRMLASECSNRGWRFIVIGDRKSPAEFNLEGCDYYSLSRQKRLNLRLASVCPEGHYARKNLGYLLAMSGGASLLVETDDDNEPREEFWSDPSEEVLAFRVAKLGWVNVYGFFSEQRIWPRGFPLDLVSSWDAQYYDGARERVRCPIQQGLADDNPDVDAVYRLLMPLPVQFSKRDPIALTDGSVCPFNSQNTSWHRSAWPLMYLPATCSFRMTDIWRSFVATRVAQAQSWGILFTSATVAQKRNEHDLMKDFADEVPGYVGNRQLWETLEALTIRPGPDSVPDGVRDCYAALIKAGFLKKEEEALVDAWLADVATVVHHLPLQGI